MERSDELRAVTARIWAAFQRGDNAAVLARFSREEGLSAFGTDESEYLEGPVQVWRYMDIQSEALPQRPLSDNPNIDAWAEGSVGWAIVRGTINGRVVSPMRCTFVFHLESDEWKLVHGHWSIGVPNEEVYGTDLKFSIEAVAEAVEEQRPDLRAAAAIDGTVTIVFTDIEGSTALNATFGDRGWIEVLRAHNRVVADQVRAHGGTVVHGLGDGFMLAFPTARGAARCAVAIERTIGQTFNDPGSPIRVRVGIHTGEVVKQADEFFGQAVNYAARVAAAAAGGEVLVSGLVHDLLATEREFHFGEPRDALLKGIDGPQRLYPMTLG